MCFFVAWQAWLSLPAETGSEAHAAHDPRLQVHLKRDYDLWLLIT